MFRQAILIVGVLVMCAPPILACSIPGMPPSRFDRTQTILSGQITGYVESAALTRTGQTPGESAMYGPVQGRSTAGIRVTVKEIYYSPDTPKKTYEVFRLSLGADCGRYGVALEWIKERYKVGDLIRVALGKAEYVANSTNPDVGRLEGRYGSDDLIETTDDLNDKAFTALSSVFGYDSYRSNLTGSPSFELRKDLYRLDVAKDQKERDRVLDRLTYYPRPCEKCEFFLYELFKNYTSSQTEFEHWAATARKREMTEDEFTRVQKSRVWKP